MHPKLQRGGTNPRICSCSRAEPGRDSAPGERKGSLGARLQPLETPGCNNVNSFERHSFQRRIYEARVPEETVSQQEHHAPTELPGEMLPCLPALKGSGAAVSGD